MRSKRVVTTTLCGLLAAATTLPSATANAQAPVGNPWSGKKPDAKAPAKPAPKPKEDAKPPPAKPAPPAPKAKAKAKPADDASKQRARKLFKMGSLAFKAGRYADAVQAYGEVYKIVPKPALWFFIGEALKQQYFAEGSIDIRLLQQALESYGRYVREAPAGKRRGLAFKAIADLEVLLAKLGGTQLAPGEGGTPGEGQPTGPPARRLRTSLMVDTPIKGAKVTIDGKEAQDAPLMLNLEAGKHKVVVSAPGYKTYEREIQLAPGQMYPLDAKLEEKPAMLSIKGDSGAEVLVDGRPAGETPILKPIEVDAGVHRVVIGDSGYDLIAEDMRLDRGETKDINVELNMTGQRITAWTLFSVGAVNAIGGAVFAGLAVSAQNKAQNVQSILDSNERAITVDEQTQLNDNLQKRDDFRRVAGVAFGAAALTAGVGLVLYITDSPGLYAAAAEQPSISDEPKDDEDEPKDDEDAIEIGGGVAPTPDGVAFMLQGRF
jgi:tetratricopeptide (TPR) repeat protein